MIPEVETYAALLRERRADILKTLEGLTSDALNWRPLPDAVNSMYALASHTLGSERKFIHEIIGGRVIERDREAELRARGESVDELRAVYVTAEKTSEDILTGLTAHDLTTTRMAIRYGEQSVRWCILRMIEHYNEHLGQIYLTRQLWENRQARLHEI